MSVRLPRASALLCTGDVVHKRSRPRIHALRYRVFSLLIDLDRIGEAVANCRLLTYNRAGPLALYDRDHFDGADLSIAATARRLFEERGFATEGRRILLLTYPRVLGFVFNPLSVHLLVSPGDELEAVIYEVSNTFGERLCYIEAAGTPSGGVYAHRAGKSLFVSPFATVEGRYDFRVSLANDNILIGVAHRDAAGPLIRTHFRAVPEPLTTRSAARALARMPAMTLKVVAGIHWEALKLWCKGVPLVRRVRSPKFSVARDGEAGRVRKG